MAVAAPEEGRAIRDQGVECLAARRRVREVGDRPAGAIDPLALRVSRSVGADRPLELIRVDLAQVAALDGQLALHRVDVRVLEPGEERLSVEPQHPRAGPDLRLDIGRRADGADAPLTDRQRIGWPSGALDDRFHAGTDEHEVGSRHWCIE